MRKTLLLLLIFLIMSACSLFRAKVLPYPEGIIFPLELAHEVVFEGEIVDSLVQQEGRLCFSTRKGYVYCFDAETQKELWKFQADDQIEMHPCSGRENMYVYDSANTLYCLNKEGRLIWKKNIKENISSGICEGPEQVFIGTEKGRILSLTQADGGELWNFQAGGALRTEPIFAQGKVIFGSDDHFLYILNLSGSLTAKFETQDKIRGGLHVDKDRLYFGSDDYHFYCYDLTRHKLKWKVKTGGKVRAYPVTDKKRVFFLCMNNVMYCLKKNNGTVLWWANIPSRSFFRPEIIDDRITVSALSPRLVCFDTETGKFAGEYEAPEEIRSNPLWTEPYLVLTQHDFDSAQGKLLFLDKSVYVTLNPSLGSPQPPNEEIIITASPGGFYLPQYEFYFRRYVEIRFGWMSYILLQVEENLQASKGKSEEDTWSWFPEKPGVYFIGVKVTDEREKASAELPFLVGSSGENNFLTRRSIMQRDEALELVKKYLKNKNLVKHCLAVEACMKAMAVKLGEDVEKWGLTGLIHDLDYEMTEKSPERHTVETVKILQEHDIGPDIIRAVQAHAEMVECQTPMEWAIFSIDPLTGLIIAATLMHPDRKLQGVDLGFIKRRYKEKSFARGAKREDIEQIKNIGMDLDEFIAICLVAMQGIDKELGL